MTQEEAEKLARDIRPDDGEHDVVSIHRVKLQMVCDYILSGDMKRWNTRPQSAPPAGEPDEGLREAVLRKAAFVCQAFAKEQRIYEGPYAYAANAARSCAGRILALIQASSDTPSPGAPSTPRPSSEEPDFSALWDEYSIALQHPGGEHCYVNQAVTFGERMYRLGLAARPKDDDAEVAEFVALLRLAPQNTNGENVAWWHRCLRAADLLERLAGELAAAKAKR